MPPPSTIVEAPRSAGRIGHLRCGVVVEDPNGAIVGVNQAFCHLWRLEVEPGSLLGRPAAEAGRPPEAMFTSPERVRERMEIIARTRVPVFEEALRRSDGVIVDLDYFPLQMGDGYGGCTWVYRVATDLRRADEIRTHNRDLEQRVVERTHELARANLDLQASLRRLGQTQEQLIHAGKMAAVGALVAGLSHELNNPLGIIVGYAQGLLRRTALDHPGREALAAIERQALRSAHLVRSLLDFSRNTRSSPQEIALAPLVERVMELGAGQARRGAIELRFKTRGPLPTLISRPQDIESALMNLVSNGIDATSSGGSVTITAAPASRGGRHGVELSVIDTGTGIPQSVLPRIFDPFFTTKPVGQGTGIGLALTRQAIEALDGRIEVRSAEGVGTTMRMWLPLAPAEVTEHVSSPATASSLTTTVSEKAAAAGARGRAAGEQP